MIDLKPFENYKDRIKAYKECASLIHEAAIYQKEYLQTHTCGVLLTIEASILKRIEALEYK